MHQSLRTLDQLPIGNRAIVRRVDCDRRVGCRLMEMGLLPGTSVEMVRRAPLGDPLKIRLRGYLLSLRQVEAAGVLLFQEGRSAEDELSTTVDEHPVFLPCPARQVPSSSTPLRVLVAGNPNAGKTTLFNALTGARARVGNYSGVTVTRSSRVIELSGGVKAEVVDLPGTYSLSTHSLDEQVAVNEILGREGEVPDAVVVVVDANAIERALYLVLQIAETGVPVVVAMNMVDEASALGVTLDADKLGRWFGSSVVPTVASAGKGLDELRGEIAKVLDHGPRGDHVWPGFPGSVQNVVTDVEDALDTTAFDGTPAARRAWAVWSLLSYDSDGENGEEIPRPVQQAVTHAREQAADDEVNLDQEVIAARYSWVEHVTADVRTVSQDATRPLTDRIDRVLTDRFLGIAVFAAVMWGLFEALFSWSEPIMGAIEGLTAATQSIVRSALVEGPFADLMIDGVIAGVGNVVVFVPQIATLFLFIAVLEDVGYLARVAFLIDRLMGRIGLHGKAFVPMLSGFACAIPAVMSTRTIESRRDRLITMLTLPMISCSARLPVYVLVTAIVFTGDARVFGIFSAAALVLLSMYALSVGATLGAAAVLRRTVLRGPRLPLVLELPPYRVPVWRNVLLATWRGLRKFLVDAGTIILTMTIILWALLSYPKSAEITERYSAERLEVTATVVDENQRAEALSALHGEEAGELLRYSIAGRVGQSIEPIIEPLGFDWRIGVGILGAFAAREVFVSTLGIVFGIAEADEESPSLRASLQEAVRADGSPLMTPLAGISLMVFFVLACQCMSTISVVQRESGSWRWPLFMFGYMTVLAYGASFTVYQVGSMLGWGL